MKNYVVALFTIGTLLFTTGCGSGPQAPDFIDLTNVKVKSASMNQMILSGDAVFNNPNSIPGKLTKTDIHIKVNDVDITDIEQNVSINVPKNSDFTVPVNFSFNPKKLTTENKGFLKNALKSFLNKELTIEYDGDVTVEVLGISFDVPVEYTEKVSIGLNYEDVN